jgi:hypothetical protein
VEPRRAAETTSSVGTTAGQRKARREEGDARGAKTRSEGGERGGCPVSYNSLTLHWWWCCAVVLWCSGVVVLWFVAVWWWLVWCVAGVVRCGVVTYAAVAAALRASRHSLLAKQGRRRMIALAFSRCSIRHKDCRVWLATRDSGWPVIEDLSLASSQKTLCASFRTPSSAIGLGDHGDEGDPLLLAKLLCVEVFAFEIFVDQGCAFYLRSGTFT